MNKSNQPRKPVLRQIAFLTWRRSLPLSVLPTPSNTENVLFGVTPEPLATISCGGSISSSSSSSSSKRASSSPFLRLGTLFDIRIGIFTGADDCWNFLEGADCARCSEHWAGGLGNDGIVPEDDETEGFRRNTGAWSGSVSTARMPEFCGRSKFQRRWLSAGWGRERWFSGSEVSVGQKSSASLRSSAAVVVAVGEVRGRSRRSEEEDDRRWRDLVVGSICVVSEWVGKGKEK